MTRGTDDGRPVLVLYVANETYGVDLANVQEIVGSQHCTRASHGHVAIEEVTSFRGETVPVIDLRQRFGLPTSDRGPLNRIVIVKVSNHLVGMVVDKALAVLRVPTESIEEPSSLATTIDSNYVRGVVKLTGRPLILLQLDTVCSPWLIDRVNDVNGEKTAMVVAA